MDPNFWREKWAKGEIAFHQREANPLLVEHMARLELPPGSRVFLPLCGKTRDIAWLLSQGYRVCGAELVSAKGSRFRGSDERSTDVEEVVSRRAPRDGLN